MERLDGETLAAVIARGRLLVARAFGVFEELANGRNAPLAPRSIEGIVGRWMSSRAPSTRVENRFAREAAGLPRCRRAPTSRCPKRRATARMRPAAPSGGQQGASPQRTPGGPEQHTLLAWAAPRKQVRTSRASAHGASARKQPTSRSAGAAPSTSR